MTSFLAEKEKRTLLVAFSVTLASFRVIGARGEKMI